MRVIDVPTSSRLCSVALALALVCAGCTSPPVKEPAEAPPAAAPGVAAASRAERPPEKAKEAPGTLKERIASKGEQELGKGIKSYEEGAYKIAAKQFQAALDLGLDAGSDQARAHKYLAFIICVTGREKSCRNEFRKALDADSKLELEPAEVGHPIWGPVFRSVKAETAAKAKSK